MQGTIAFDGTLSGSIAGGGGGGGSEVTISPVLTEGEKIADFEIDGTPGELYAPEPTQLPDHIVNDIHGFSYTPYPATEIARYTIDDGVEQSIYVPDYETTWEAYPGVDQDYTIGILRCYGSTYNVKIPNYQKPLTAGANITIDPDTNTISASGGSSWDYSTSEVNTGQKWTDGKDIYCRVFNISPLTMSTGGIWYATGCVIPNIDKLINVMCSGGGDTSYGSITADYSNDNINLINFRIAIVDTITAFYTKS